MLLLLGGLFLAIASYQLYSGKAFTDTNANPASVSRRKKPKTYWFFVALNVAVGLFMIAAGLPEALDR
jgi:hypothetical protein